MTAYDLILRGDLFSQKWQNNMCYELLSGTGTAEDLAITWEAEILPQLASATANDNNFVSIEARSRINPTDFHILSPLSPDSGTVTSDALPPFCTASIQLNRTRTDVRNGAKRFCGVPEGHQNNGVFVPTAAAIWQNFADLLVQALVSSTGASYQYFYDAKQRGTGLELQVFPETAQLNVNVGSQNSRKIGRGQ